MLKASDHVRYTHEQLLQSLFLFNQNYIPKHPYMSVFLIFFLIISKRARSALLCCSIQWEEV